MLGLSHFTARSQNHLTYDRTFSRLDNLSSSPLNVPVSSDCVKVYQDVDFRNEIPSDTITKSKSPESQDNMFKLVMAAILFCLPLLLSSVLMGLIYDHLLRPEDLPKGLESITAIASYKFESSQVYYVDHPATKLVFVSSLLSTLALGLLPAGMYVFSYMVSYSMRNASESRSLSDLPSPYQFELCLRMLGGGTVEVYHYALYLVRNRQKRVKPVNILHRTAGVFMAFLLVAASLTLVDALLHIGAVTINLPQIVPYKESNFSPGRVMPFGCWNNGNNDSQLNYTHACNFQAYRNGDHIQKFLVNSSEA